LAVNTRETPHFHFLIVKKKNAVFYHIESDIVTLHRIFDSRRDYISAIEFMEKIEQKT